MPETKPTTGKHAGGRPPMYNDPEVMQIEIDKYFAKCDVGETIERWDKKKQEVVKIVRQIPYTVPGLVYALGFADDKGLQEYKTKENGKFSHTLSRAWKIIEQQRNERALTGEQEPRFAQFDLKNNFGWKEQTDIVVRPMEELTDTELDIRIEAATAKMLKLPDEAVIATDVADDVETTLEDGL